MKDKMFLMIPGPTPVPETVLLAMAKHPIGHRSGEFEAILKYCYEGLKEIFQTKNDVFIYAASGTGAMEAALSNLVNEGDKVLSLVIGNFGNRWAKIAKSLGAEVQTIDKAYGETVSVEELKAALDADVNKEIKIVTMTHSETSTGAKNDIQALCKLVQEHGALSVVDGVTSVSAMEVKMDEWGIDVLVSGSQKGFMIPPGLSFLAASDKAYAVYEQCKHPSFYFDWAAHRKAVRNNTTPYTAAVNLIFALQAAIEMIKEEGMEKIYARHKKHAIALRSAIRAIGLKLFVEDDNKVSYSITSILPPEGVSVPDIRSGLKKDYDIIVANGQNDLKDKIFRMGTLGFVSQRDVLTAVASLEAVLFKLGYKFELGAGVKAAIEAMK
ncbi:alanine--glyoxylate aminotransferase family protein [bacterium]|nr:alanine--glyoxylate aminotransferase family protein [bacterium]